MSSANCIIIRYILILEKSGPSAPHCFHPQPMYYPRRTMLNFRVLNDIPLSGVSSYLCLSYFVTIYKVEIK